MSYFDDADEGENTQRMVFPEDPLKKQQTKPKKKLKPPPSQEADTVDQITKDSRIVLRVAAGVPQITQKDLEAMARVLVLYLEDKGWV